MKLRSVCALFVIAVVLSSLPQCTAREGIPWRVELAQRYAAGGYVVLDRGLYAVGFGSQKTNALLGYVSRETGWVDERYVFVQCWLGRVRYLSPWDPKDRELLERARFYGPGDPGYPKYQAMYQEWCWGAMANADRFYRYFGWAMRPTPE